MFEWWNNILCVQAGWLYNDGKIMTEDCYKKLTYRKDIQVLRRACKGRPALVAYESMPERYKSAIEAITGDPYKKVEENELLKYIKEDTTALDFYRKYRYGEDKPLPDETIREYYADVLVMNAIGELLAMRKAVRAKLGRRSMADVWKKISQSVNSLPSRQYPCRLPENDRRLKEKFKDYKKEGYTLFIHKGFGNSNTEKLNDQVKLWILSQWANNIERITSERHLLDVYNEHAAEMQQKGGEDSRIWKPIRSEQTLHNFLFSDGIRNLWWGARYGELKSKEKFMYQHSTLMPTMRDSLWYSDGTKLNFFFRDDKGSVSTMSVYEVMDVYSEVFVGYAFCETENYAAQREAFRHALLFAGEKPFQVTFDNQGGHKKMEATSFLSKLARVAIKTKPYNGKSKTIESAFGRYQKMFMKRKFFFTGQNITAKSDESKANREFLLANKENLPTLEEVKQIYLEQREEWNRGKHPKSAEGLTRLEMYRNSRNDALVEIRQEDMIDLFCVEHASPVRVTPGGLAFEKDKKEYTYVVNEKDNYIPDVAWIAAHVDHRYIVKYDPDDMSEIHLFDKSAKGLLYAGTAQQKVTPHRNKQEQEEWEARFFAEVESRIKAIRIKQRDEMDEILRQHNLLPEQHGLNSPLLQGIESSKAAQQRPESRKRKFRKEKTKGIAEVEKEISNIVTLGGEDDEIDKVLDNFNDKFLSKKLYDIM